MTRTVSDVIEAVQLVGVVTTLFGSDPDFYREYRERAEAVGRAICEEQHVTYGTKDALLVPPHTLLGVKSGELFGALETWLAEKDERFKKTKPE